MENLNMEYNKEVLIRRALLRFKTKTEAARHLGISRRSVFRHIDRYGINA